MQVELDNYEHNYQPQALSEILQRKTFCLVSFDSNFVGIYWLIESKVVLIIAPHQTKKYFFSDYRKIEVSGVSIAEFFYVNGKQFKSNSDQSEKISRKHEVSKKEIDNCHSGRKLETGSGKQNDCSKNFEKISRKTFMVIYIFWFYQQNYSIKDVFFAIFSNILEHLRTASSEIIQEISLNSFLSYRSSHSQEL